MVLQRSLIGKFLEIVECLADKYRLIFSIRDYKGVVTNIAADETLTLYRVTDTTYSTPLVALNFGIPTFEQVSSQEFLDQIAEYAITFIKAIDTENRVPNRVELGECSRYLTWGCAPWAPCLDRPYDQWGKYCCPTDCPEPDVPQPCTVRPKVCLTVTQSICYEIVPATCRKCKCDCEKECGCKCKKVGQEPCSDVKVDEDPFDSYDPLGRVPTSYTFCYYDPLLELSNDK